MKKFVLIFLSFSAFIFMVFPGNLWDFKPNIPKAEAASYNPSNIISDGEFINTGSMSAGDVQSFLSNKGGYLKDFSEGGRSAAQIIYDAAHGYGDASGNIYGVNINTSTGTVNPKVLIVTLQKEQSLITSTARDDSVLNKAMGYACPDSGGCNSSYVGFTKQVENGAWQLRYNYERAQGRGFADYQVSQNFCFNDDGSTHPGNNCGTFDNRATASLYRYTPHVYNGNYNFWNNYYNWFLMPEYAAQIISQGPYSGPGSYGYKLTPGEAMTLWVTLRNVGSATWSKSGANPVHIGTSSPHDRNSVFLNNANVRAEMADDVVASGESTTFTFNATAPNSPGQYNEQFEVLAEYKAWMSTALSWSLEVASPTNQYVSGSQGPFSGPGSYGNPVSPGQTIDLTIQFKNTGSYAWSNSGAHPVQLGTDSPQDRISSWIGSNRAARLKEPTVDVGANGTFEFAITAPSAPGTYGEHFKPLMEGVAWMNNEVYWQIIVGNPLSAQYVSGGQGPQTADAKIHLSPGQSTTLTVQYKNTSGANWYSTGGPTNNAIYLGQANPRDRGSVFTGGNNLRGNLQSYGTANGDIGTFIIGITAPSQKGTYREWFDLVVDGVGWLNVSAFWDIIVE